MKCLNLTDIEHIPSKKLIRVDDVYLASRHSSASLEEMINELSIKTVIHVKSNNEESLETNLQKLNINFYEINFDKPELLSSEQLQKFNSILSKREAHSIIYCETGEKAASLLALNSCLCCGHPKQRALEFGLTIGLKTSELKNQTEHLIKQGRL